MLAVAGAAWLGFLSSAWSAETQYDSGNSGAAGNLLNDSFRAGHHGHYSEAIALDSKAIAIAPNYGEAYESRAGHYADAGRYDEADADYAHVAAMHPDDVEIPLAEARLKLYRGDAAGAMIMIKKAANMPIHFYRHLPHETAAGQGGGYQYDVTGHAPTHIYALSSIAEQLLHQDDASIADMAAMVKEERDHPEYIMSYHCWTAAVSGLLESAELTCQEAIDDNHHDIGQYDSMGYVHLRMKAWDKAIADYNTALDKRSDLTTSLYGRGIAKRARGDTAGGNADIAAATQGEPDIANIMKRLGAPVS
jgi:tetratricopeptide (TPR) repeat protein